MKQFLAIMIFSVLLSGCLASAQPATFEASEIQQISIHATGIALAQATQTATPTAAPTLTVPVEDGKGPTFRDDFNSKLQPGWTWVNEDKNNWSLSLTPGSLMIKVVGGYINLGNATNVLLRPAPESDFLVETALTFTPDENNQFAGLILYESNQNYIQVGNSFCSPINGCVGQGLYVDTYRNGGLTLPRVANRVKLDKISLQVVRRGNIFNFYASADGQVWYLITQSEVTINVLQVGLITGQNVGDIVPTALFDYFELNTIE